MRPESKRSCETSNVCAACNSACKCKWCGCRQVMYCSVDCQRRHRPQHKAQCHPPRTTPAPPPVPPLEGRDDDDNGDLDASRVPHTKLGPEYSGFEPSDEDYSRFVLTSLGSRYDPREKQLKEGMRQGECMGVVLPQLGFLPSPVVLSRVELDYYLSVAEKSELIQQASSGEVPLLVAKKKDQERRATNTAASWLMLDARHGWEYALDKWAGNDIGDVILLRSDGKDFVCGDAAFCYDLASNILEQIEEGKTPDAVKTWKLHQRVKKHAFK